MRLTIDTTTDSQAEIKKAIRLLSSLINHAPLEEGFTNEVPEISQQPVKDVFESNAPLTNLMSMFDTSEPLKTPKSKKEPMMEIY